MQASNRLNCKTKEVQQIKADNGDVHDANSNMPDYLRYSIRRAIDKKASQVLTNKIHNEFGDVMKAFLIYSSRLTASHTRYPQEGSICTSGTPEGDARKTTKAINNSASRHG